MLTAVTGINWGDEGKGRVIDLLAERADIVVRYQGGNNAGGDGLEQDRAVPHLHLTDEHRALHAVDGRLVKLQGESAAIREGEGAAGRFPVQPQLLWRAYCPLYGLRYFPAAT